MIKIIDTFFFNFKYTGIYRNLVLMKEIQSPMNLQYVQIFNLLNI